MRALNDDHDVAQRGGHTPANRLTEACRFGLQRTCYGQWANRFVIGSHAQTRLL